MKRWFVVFVLAAAVVGGAAMAQSQPNAEWLGVWHAELDGQPSVILTLADDTGALGGTLVLNLIEKEPGGSAHVVQTDAHVLINPHADQNLLSFACKKPSGELIHFAAARGADGGVTIHCLDCGAGAPTVQLTRSY
jgi:hypothetical protein